MFNELKDYPTAPEGQVYVYALLNELDQIKIGITKNPYKRFNSLSGSNGRGVKLIRYFLSEPTYLKSVEKTLHEYFSENRIQNTEWFQGLYYEDVIEKIKSLFHDPSYQRCNEVKRLLYIKNLSKQNKKKG